MTNILILMISLLFCIVGVNSFGWSNENPKVMTVNVGANVEFYCVFKENKSLLRNRAKITKEIMYEGNLISYDFLRDDFSIGITYPQFENIFIKKSHVKRYILNATIVDTGTYYCESWYNQSLDESHKFQLIVQPVLKSVKCHKKEKLSGNKSIIPNEATLHIVNMPNKTSIYECTAKTISLNPHDEIGFTMKIGKNYAIANTKHFGYTETTIANELDPLNGTPLYEIISNISIVDYKNKWNTQKMYLDTVIYNSSRRITFNMAIRYPPHINCSVREVFASVGDSVEFFCILTSNPSSQIKLMHKDTELGDPHSRFNTIYNSISDDSLSAKLIVKDLVEKDLNTEYKLSSVNTLGSTEVVLKISRKSSQGMKVLSVEHSSSPRMWKIEIMFLQSLMLLLSLVFGLN